MIAMTTRDYRVDQGLDPAEEHLQLLGASVEQG
jgi:hypothetical protein